MSAEILKNTPISGESEEKHFGNQFSMASLWVEFIDNEHQKWFGCFPCYNSQMLNTVITDDENETALVISAGTGYLINIKTKTLLLETGAPVIVSAIITRAPQYYIVGTFSSFLILDQKQLIKEVSPYLFVDGIYLIKQVGKKAVGILDSVEMQYQRKINFELDLTTFDLTIDGKPERTI